MKNMLFIYNKAMHSKVSQVLEKMFEFGGFSIVLRNTLR